jgi:2-polyprenyl-6-methoxyphenol hydroxylase-like FAD-dependent oxidoreductase
MASLPSRTEVLIIGAGPVGLTLAAELRKRGIASAIVDQHAANPGTSRAAVVHARTLEVLEGLGVTTELIAQGVEVPFFSVRDRDRTLVTIDFRDIPSQYRYTLMCPQERTEQILLGRLEDLGGGVVRPCELLSVKAQDSCVEAILEFDGKQRTVSANWLVGCDGMHSRVREQAGIAFVGASYEQSFVLADVHMDWPLSREEVSLFFSPDGLVVVAPLPEDRFRIVATVDDAPEHSSTEFIQTLLDRRGPQRRRGRIADIVWRSRFRLHHRVAETPRKGRILLCGDAAHVHSPAGGQGMNIGIQDSVSLAEALSRVVEDGDEMRLYAWSLARHRVASDVVSFTDRMTRVATVKSGAAQALRNILVSAVGHLPAVRARLAQRLAEMDGA